MNIEFLISRVIAFDKSGVPIASSEKSWTLRIDPQARVVHVQHKRASLSYDLQKDVLALVRGGEKQEAAVGKTLGRIALTGLAAGSLAQGKGFGGALMDLAIRGGEKRTIVAGVLYLRDSSTLGFKCSEDNFVALSHMVSSSARSEEAIQLVAKREDFLERLVKDDGRALSEIESRVTELSADLTTQQTIADSGESFDNRDAARRRVDQIKSEVEDQIQISRATSFLLARALKGHAEKNIEASEGRERVGLLARISTVLFVLFCAVGVVMGAVLGLFVAVFVSMAAGWKDNGGFVALFMLLGAIATVWSMLRARKRKV